MVAEPVIKIAYGDWLDEYIEAEKDVSDREKLLERIKEGMTTPQAGRMALVARERGEAEPDMLPANKTLLASGAMHEISSLVMRQRRTVTLSNGRTIEVREFVAPVPADEDAVEGDPDAEQYEMAIDGMETPAEMADDNMAIVSVDDPLSAQRARSYLIRRVPGYIYNRLAILAASGESVRDAANELIKTIWEMVERLE